MSTEREALVARLRYIAATDDAKYSEISATLTEAADALSTAPAGVVVPEGFTLTDLEDVADGLESGYEKTVNVGAAIEPGHDVHLESTTAYAARFIRAILAAAPKEPPKQKRDLLGQPIIGAPAAPQQEHQS